MRWDESPRYLLLASLASAVLSAALSLAAIWDHPGYNVAAAGLALLTITLAYRANAVAAAGAASSFRCRTAQRWGS